MSGNGKAVAVALVPVLLFVVIIVAAFLTDVDEQSDPTPPPQLDGPDPALQSLGSEAPAPDAEVLGGVLDPIADGPDDGRIGAMVVDDLTGEVLWERESGTADVPASSAKLLTALAALTALPPDATVDTVVGTEATAEPGTPPESGALVVVPGGDPAMTADGDSEFFPGSASLADLAGQVQESGVTPTELVVSPGLYDGPPLGPEWNEADIEGGHVTPMEPWMLDAGRMDPDDIYSPRSRTPMFDAAHRLAAEIGVPSDAVSIAEEPVPLGEEVARVSSAPLVERVRASLEHSDNIATEGLCREVALHRNPEEPASFRSSTRAVLDVLTEAGIDTAGSSLADCSGMSHDNALTPAVLAGVLGAASAPDAPRVYRTILDSLPVARATGTLGSRYDGDAAPGAGWVRAKTGTLTDITSLTGTVTTSDGRPLTFAFMATGMPVDEGRATVDRLAAALHECGCR